MFNFRERHRRHKIVHTHGLILPNRTKSWLAKYNKATGLKKCHDNNLNSGRFVALMQLTTGLAFDRIVEGLQYEYDLRKYLSKLVFQVVLQFSPHFQFKALFQCQKKTTTFVPQTIRTTDQRNYNLLWREIFPKCENQSFS